jgi:hypothetical protein
MIQKKHNFSTLLKYNLPIYSSALFKTNKGTRYKLGLNDDNNTNQDRFSHLTPLEAAPKQEVVSITYEEIGLFPRSFSRVLDRFLKQVFSDVENLVIQEYRFYRYLFLTTLKCLLILFFVPFIVNFLAKSYVVRPLTEYFWNTKQTEIFLNSYQQKHAFAELKDFEEKLYFESLIYPKSVSPYSERVKPAIVENNSPPLPVRAAPASDQSRQLETLPTREGAALTGLLQSSGVSQTESISLTPHVHSSSYQFTPIKNNITPSLKDNQETKEKLPHNLSKNWIGSTSNFVNFYKFPKNIEFQKPILTRKTNTELIFKNTLKINNIRVENSNSPYNILLNQHKKIINQNPLLFQIKALRPVSLILKKNKNISNEQTFNSPSEYFTPNKIFYVHPIISNMDSNINERTFIQNNNISNSNIVQQDSLGKPETSINPKSVIFNISQEPELKTNSSASKNSFLVYQTIEADKNIQQRYQEKTLELAQRYNDQSVEAITNFFGDVVSLVTLFYLLYVLEIQINITQSFLLEVFFGLDDSKKSLLILLVTDLLVGYHSSNLWELFFELFFNHYGLPESQTGIFLLVATLPVLLDVLFKYLIFRHLNRSSPATVATYHAIIE